MLARLLLRSQASRLIVARPASIPAIATRQVRFYAADPDEAAAAGLGKKVNEVLQSSKTMKDFATDPRVAETTKRLKSLLESKGYSISNPPGKLAMLGLIADGEFRAIINDMRLIAKEHNIDEADIMRMGQIGMEAKTTVTDAVETASKVKDEVVDTAQNAEVALEDKIKSKL